MRNLFEVDSNEIKRILSLHEESTKKQYLNVLSEQTANPQQIRMGQSYVLKNQATPGTNDITLPPNTIFKKSTVKDILVTDKMVLGFQFSILEYNCVTGKFKTQSSPALYNSDDLEEKYLKPFCTKVNQVVAPTKTTTPTNTKKPVSTVNIVSTNKSIQTSLGNATPTGQITDTDLDQLITQLNK